MIRCRLGGWLMGGPYRLGVGYYDVFPYPPPVPWGVTERDVGGKEGLEVRGGWAGWGRWEAGLWLVDVMSSVRKLGVSWPRCKVQGARCKVQGVIFVQMLHGSGGPLFTGRTITQPPHPTWDVP